MTRPAAWYLVYVRKTFLSVQKWHDNCFNRPFLSSLVPLLQNESKCEIFLMKMSSACRFIFMQIKVIFIRMVSHLDLLWNRGTRELGKYIGHESCHNYPLEHACKSSLNGRSRRRNSSTLMICEIIITALTSWTKWMKSVSNSFLGDFIYTANVCFSFASQESLSEMIFCSWLKQQSSR